MADSPRKPGPEHRAAPRIPLELRIEYARMNTLFSDYTRNISKGGTFIKTDKPLPPGTQLVFKLAIAALGQVIELRGQVVWVNSDTHQQHPEVPDRGMGIRFIYESPEARRRFEDAVEELMRSSLGERASDKLLGERRPARPEPPR